MQLVAELQLVGDLVDGGQTAQAATKLITDLLEGPRHLRRVHGGVHLDAILVSPELYQDRHELGMSHFMKTGEVSKILLAEGQCLASLSENHEKLFKSLSSQSLLESSCSNWSGKL